MTTPIFMKIKSKENTVKVTNTIQLFLKFKNQEIEKYDVKTTKDNTHIQKVISKYETRQIKQINLIS